MAPPAIIPMAAHAIGQMAPEHVRGDDVVWATTGPEQRTAVVHDGICAVIALLGDGKVYIVPSHKAHPRSVQ